MVPPLDQYTRLQIEYTLRQPAERERLARQLEARQQQLEGQQLARQQQMAGSPSRIDCSTNRIDGSPSRRDGALSGTDSLLGGLLGDIPIHQQDMQATVQESPDYGWVQMFGSSSGHDTIDNKVSEETPIQWLTRRVNEIRWKPKRRIKYENSPVSDAVYSYTDIELPFHFSK